MEKIMDLQVYSILFVAVVSFQAAFTYSEKPIPIVTVSTGKLQGTFSRPINAEKGILTFLGIPFAAPPIGRLRFLPPQPVKPWSGIRLADKFGHHCPQDTASADRIYSPLVLPHHVTSEDCLVLNVYTPSVTGARAVLVWIHGGGNQCGSGSQFDGTVLSARHDLVVVTLNYRLGPFGFLSTLDDSMPGNAGLWDQQAALRWIQKNIAEFGGDPRQVTLAGESAGGASVAVHVTSSASTGLFRRAISLSGAAAMLPKLYADPVHESRLLAEKLNCVYRGIAEMVDCMRLKSADEIISTSQSLPFLYHFIVDGDMLANNPLLLYKQKYFNQVDYMVGIDNDEGYTLSSGLFGDNLNKTLSFDDIKNHVKSLVSMYSEDSLDLLAQLIVDFYLGLQNNQSEELLRQRASLLTGHMINSAPIVRTAQLHSVAVRNTFLFVFKYRPSYSTRPDWIISDHGQELPYLFGSMFSSQYTHSHHSYNAEDEHMTNMAMQYFANFIKTGDPNSADVPVWPSFAPGEQFLVMSPNVSVGQRYEHELMQFWNNKFTSMLTTAAPPVHEEF